MRRLALTAVLALGLALPASAAVSGGGLQAAIKIVRTKGYCVDSTRTWERAPTFRLNVLIGTLCRSADGYNKRAFFFYDSRYLGTDAARASAQVQEVWRDDRTIALLYILYRRNDPLCCPTGGGKIVRFHWNGTRLVALDTIPTDDFNAPLHR
jgi:hypothetical protein